MKILFTHHRYHTNLFNWFRGFQLNGHEVKLLVYKSDEVEISDLPKSECLPPSKWSIRKMKKNPRKRGDGVDSFSPYYYPSLKTLYRYFKTERPDLVVIRPVFTRFGYLSLAMSIWFGCRVVFHSRIRIYKEYSRVKKIVIKMLLGLFNAYWISPCKGDFENFSLASKRLIYFPFLIEQQVEGRDYFKNGNVNILCVAKYFKSKNPLLMLEVFAKLRKEYQNISLTICGTGDENGEYFLNMLKVARDTGFNESIQLLINQPKTKMDELYRTHDVFVLPTRHDPASFTVLEAMAYGLATITTDVDGSEAYISKGENGYVVPRDDQGILIENLRLLINNRDQTRSFGKESLFLIKERHHPKQIAKEFLTNIHL